MSTNQNGIPSRKKNGGKTQARSVRFASQKQEDPPPARRKRPRMERPNEDEEDDVDDWVDDEEHMGPSAKELLDAKRTRRLKRDHVEDDDSDDEEGEETHIDASTSMMADDHPDENDVPIEPFNMDAERTDGSGYFDGDTYVFRKRDEDEEPDAWLESLGDADQKLPAKQKTASEEEESSETGDMDELSREELCAKLIPLVSDSETVLQALVRYGELIKLGQNMTTNNDKQASSSSSLAHSMAQEALNSLTEASNALLLKGDVDIYQKTRKDLMKLVPTKQTLLRAAVPVVQWEYRGNQDGELHGPYTTEQMKSWTGAGYFVGEQAVQIRTVAPSTINEKKNQKPTVDDLLSDLMDDDDPKEDESPQEVRGEWMSSNDVYFSEYA